MEENEYWRDIPNYKSLYQISNLGRIKSIRKDIIMQTWKNNKGYVAIYLYKKRERTKYRVHYLVCKTFRGYARGDRNEVNHKNFNKEDNRIANLHWCNRRFNMRYNSKRNKHGFQRQE